MNLPAQVIHDPESSFGRLVIPYFKGKWLAYFEGKGFKLTSKYGFHNCTVNGY